MARRALLTLLVLIVPVIPRAAPASTPADNEALIDSLLAWHDASRPDMVDSLAGPAIAAARAAADSPRLLPLLLVRGACRSAFGRARGAETDLREARHLAAVLADTTRAMQTTRWLGIAVGRQGRAAEADVLYHDLEQLAAAAGDSVHLGWAWTGIAYGHYLHGRTDAAGALYGRAAGVLERAGVVDGATWARNGQALALRQAGRYREAREAFARVVGLAVVTGDALNEALALGQLGRLDLQLGDPAQAIVRFERSVAINRAHDRLREGLLPYIDIAAAMQMQGRFVAAAARLDSAAARARQHGLRDLELLATVGLADALLAQERPAAAAARCRTVLAEGELPSLLVGTELRLRLARALADRDSLAAAIGVLEGIAAAGAGAVSLELRTAGLLGSLLVDAGRPTAALAVLTAADSVASVAGAEAERVILLTETGRAAMACDRPQAARDAFARAIASWEQVRAWPSDPVWREHRGTIAGSLFAQATAALLAGPPETAPERRLAAAWSCAQRHKARTLQERMQGPGVGASAAPLSPSLSALQVAFLRPGEVLIDVIEGERQAVIFCVTRDTATAHLLPGRRVQQPRLRRLLDIVTSEAVKDPETALAHAAHLLAGWPAEVVARLGAAELVFWSPDGSWHRFPSALLPTAGATARLPAADVLARLRLAGGASRRDALILAVSGPDPAGGGLLPGAAAETRWLASRLENVVRQDPPPGEPAAAVDTAAWAGADVLHLAAHTSVDPWQPWNTALTLARGETGTIRAAAVAELPLRARLAVLTGCATAGSRVVAGEGMVGLAGAFMAARTPAVVATAWPVDDAAAARVTARFYEGLAEGLTAAAALARARDHCRADPTTAAPRHWAAYELFGDGAVTVAVQPRHARWPWALGLALAAALAVGLARR